MRFAGSWAEEKRRYGLGDTKDTKAVLKSFLTIFDRATLLNPTHAKIYDRIKNKVSYKDFAKKMKEITEKDMADSKRNVKRVKSQLLHAFGPEMRNAMRTYLKKSGKNFGIQNQRQRRMQDVFVEEANAFLDELSKLHRTDVNKTRQMVQKHKQRLQMIDMYWNETMPFGVEMTHRENLLALDSLKGYYNTRLKIIG
jgi:hypothetical protein